MATLDLAGKTALVTGAASGIGRASALAFARAGADLVVCDLNEAGLEETAGMIRGLGRRVLASRVDVASREAMAAFAAEVHREREAVDVLMNNAGVGLGARFFETSLEAVKLESLLRERAHRNGKVTPLDPDQPGYRDVLVVTFRRE